MNAANQTVYLANYQAPNYLLKTTTLTFTLFETHALVYCQMKFQKNTNNESFENSLILYGVRLELIELALDGRVLIEDEYTLTKESLVLTSLPDEYVISSITRIKPQSNTTLEGLYKSNEMFCTQCEAEGFRRITYYPDRPDVLSRFTTRIEADKANYPVLLSNGNCIDKGELPEGRHYAVWEDPFPKPSYLFALVAGQLESVSDRFTTCSGREVTLKIFVEAKDLNKCDFAMESLKRAMRWDEEVYGREYDLDIFMIVAVDHFNMGAMENKGLNIFNSSCILANPKVTTDVAFQRIEAIVAHEYFHNWSGNRVTCRDWFQLSLKEGFTVYRDGQFSASMGSAAVNRVEEVNFLRTVQFAEDAGPMAHAVRPDSYIEISNFYTVTIYEKGAEVVGMLARMLGKEKFRQATDIYFSRFDGQAVTTEDFVQVMEEVSGQNLQQFRRWYTQAGTPELSVSWEYNNSSNQLHMKVIQKSRGEPFHIPLALALLNPQGNPVAIRQAGEQMILTERVLDIKNAEQHFTFVNITEPVVPSLLRGFSAPVKLTAEYSQDDLLFLLTYDQDGYVRWDAAQQLSLHAILQGMTQLREGRSFHLDQALVVAFEKVLREALLHNSGSSIDKSMLANLLTLPSEAYLAELFSSIDVDLIHNVREKVKHQLARQLQLVLAEIYHANKEKEAYTYSHEQVSRRALKNMALSYLVSLEDPAWHHAAWLQFEGSDNMTDALGALRALQLSPAQGARKLATELMENFYLQWKTEPLVVEQWFSLQASTPGKDRLSAIEKLLAHPAFDWNNPNKLRAVIGAFCNNNHIGFHKLDGSGYNFLIDQILKLNKTNPQIASRLLTPMTRWRKHDESRQQLMRSALQKLAAQEDLSKDVSEVVFKSLELIV